MASLNYLTGTSWHTADIDVARHLELLGLERVQPSLAVLEDLHQRHVHAFPFAAVDVLLGQHPGVEPATLSRRLLTEQQGGYCFEHAQLFAATCEALGFEVRRHLGRVHAATNPRTHMSVEVVIDGIRYLTDPGFGLSITGPVELRDGAHRHEYHGEYTIHRFENRGIEYWELRRNGDTAHVSDSVPVMPIDVTAGHVVTSTHSATRSPFTHGLIISRYTTEGHVSLAGTTLTTRSAGQSTTRQELSADEAIAMIRDLGVILDEDRAQRLRAVLDPGAARG